MDELGGRFAEEYGKHQRLEIKLRDMRNKTTKWVTFALLTVLWHPALSQYFRRVGDYIENRAVVQEYIPGVGKMSNYGYVNEYDKLVIPMKYTHARSFYNGIAIVGIGSKYGLINKTGKIVYPIVCDELEKSYNYNGVGLVYDIKVNGLSGLLDGNGKVLIPCKYWSIRIEQKDVGYCFVVKRPDGNTDLYTVNGKTLLPEGYSIPNEYKKPKYAEYTWNVSTNGFCVIVKDGKYGVFDLVKSKIILDTEFDWADIRGDCFITVKNDLYGLARKDGTQIYPNTFRRIRGGNNYFYIYNEKEEFGVYNAEKQVEELPVGCKEVGEDIVACNNMYRFWNPSSSYQYDDCWYDEIIRTNVEVRESECEFILKRHGKYGIKALKEVNYKHILVEVLPFEYDFMSYDQDFQVSFAKYEGLTNLKRVKTPVIHFRKDGEWGMFADGVLTRTVSDKKLEETGHFLVAQKNGKYGFYESNDKIQFKYDKKPVVLFKDVWLVETRGKSGVVILCRQGDGGLSASGDYMGLVVKHGGRFVDFLSPIYDRIRVFDGRFVLTEKEGIIGFARLNCSKEDQNVIELPYKEAEYRGFHPITIGKVNKWIPVFSVKRNNKWGLVGVDDNNRVLVIARPQYDSIAQFIGNEAWVSAGKKQYRININGQRVSEKMVIENNKLQPLQPNMMIIGNYNLSNNMQHSYGCTLAYAERFGIYVSMAGNNLTLAPESTISSEQQQDYFWNGESSTSRFLATAGGMYAFSRFGYVFAGVGYSQRNLMWKTMSDKLIAISPDSFKGVAMEAGLMLNLKGFLISIGGLKQINRPYYEVKFGIGVNIKTQKQ